MSTDKHKHEHSDWSETERRVRELENILVEKGYVDPKVLDSIVDAYETKIGPQIGARVVAKAWREEDFKKRLLGNAADAVNALNLTAPLSHQLVAVENTKTRHNMIVCTLCSCYPWEILGLPPEWYKSFAYRSRAVKEPRKVLSEFGVTLADDIEIRVWDSTSEMRYLVVPIAPDGIENLSEDEVAALVTRECMVGTGLPKAPARGK